MVKELVRLGDVDVSGYVGLRIRGRVVRDTSPSRFFLVGGTDMMNE